MRQSFVRQSFVRQSFVRQSFVSFARGEKRKREGGRRGRSGLATVKIRTPHRDVGNNRGSRPDLKQFGSEWFPQT